MSAHRLAELLGRTVTWHIFNLEIPVEIVDARANFGRIDIEVKPVGGSGTHWVSDRAIVES